MKSSKLLLAISLLGLSLTSCNESNGIDIGDKILSYKSLVATAPVVIQTLSDLNNIVHNDDCIIYVSQAGCQSCEALEPELLAYIEETKNLIYEVDIQLYSQAYNSIDNEVGQYADLFPRLSVTPSFLFYRGGALKHAIVSAIAPNTLSDLMSEYVYDVPFYSLNSFNKIGDRFYLFQYEEDGDKYFSSADLANFISSKDSATILYTWRNCSDCKEFKANVLEPFLISEEVKPVYFFETSNFYEARNSSDMEVSEKGSLEWEAFCLQYHLSDYSFVDAFSNEAGVTPTIVNYQGDEHYLAIFRNDRSFYRDEQGYLRYQYSFYDEVKELHSDTKVEEGDTTSSNYQKAISELREKAFEIEAEACLNFLKEHL